MRTWLWRGTGRPGSFSESAAGLLPGLIDTPILSDQIKATAPSAGIWRLTPPAEVADAVWQAYHSDKLPWHVPGELVEFDLQATAEPKGARGACGDDDVQGAGGTSKRFSLKKEPKSFCSLRARCGRFATAETKGVVSADPVLRAAV